MTVNGDVFATHDKFEPYLKQLDNIESGTNNDTFSAITVATKLIFTAGASKVFVLIPCSNCSSFDTKVRNSKLLKFQKFQNLIFFQFDYSSVFHLLTEHDIDLHIMTDNDFIFDKAKISKGVFGLDSTKVFVKKDLKLMEGDEELRKHTRVPKPDLGSCAALALETEGSIFTTKRMDKEIAGKKFATVFAKRIAMKARKSNCQICECTGQNTGAAYLVCLPCSYPLSDGDYDVSSILKYKLLRYNKLLFFLFSG